MKLIYQNKEIELVECKSFFSRLKGFMFQKNINKALLFNRCSSVHTFFMKEKIDIILCDKNNKILYYYPEVQPNHVILPKKNVYRVYELPIYYYNIQIQDELEVKE